MGCRHRDRENGGRYSRRLIDLGSEPMARRCCSIAQLISGPARGRLGPWTAGLGGLAAAAAVMGMMRVRRTRPCEKNKTTSMPLLPRAVFRRSAHPCPAEILLQASVPPGEQASEPKPVARKAGEPAVLLRPTAREPSSSVARGESGVCARTAAKEARVTRDEAGARP